MSLLPPQSRRHSSVLLRPPPACFFARTWGGMIFFGVSFSDRTRLLGVVFLSEVPLEEWDLPTFFFVLRCFVPPPTRREETVPDSEKTPFFALANSPPIFLVIAVAPLALPPFPPFPSFRSSAHGH